MASSSSSLRFLGSVACRVGAQKNLARSLTSSTVKRRGDEDDFGGPGSDASLEVKMSSDGIPHSTQSNLARVEAAGEGRDLTQKPQPPTQPNQYGVWARNNREIQSKLDEMDKKDNTERAEKVVPKRIADPQPQENFESSRLYKTPGFAVEG